MGPMGWLFSLAFATLLSSDKADLAAAESECLNRPHGNTDVTCVVVRASDLKDGVGTGKYAVAPADGEVGVSIGREDVARFMLTLPANTDYDGQAVSVGGLLEGRAGADSKATSEPDAVDERSFFDRLLARLRQGQKVPSDPMAPLPDETVQAPPPTARKSKAARDRVPRLEQTVRDLERQIVLLQRVADEAYPSTCARSEHASTTTPLNPVVVDSGAGATPADPK